MKMDSATWEILIATNVVLMLSSAVMGMLLLMAFYEEIRQLFNKNK
jgi:hypothetical protein